MGHISHPALHPGSDGLVDGWVELTLCFARVVLVAEDLGCSVPPWGCLIPRPHGRGTAGHVSGWRGRAGLPSAPVGEEPHRAMPHCRAFLQRNTASCFSFHNRFSWRGVGIGEDLLVNAALQQVLALPEWGWAAEIIYFPSDCSCSFGISPKHCLCLEIRGTKPETRLFVFTVVHVARSVAVGFVGFALPGLSRV